MNKSTFEALPSCESASWYCPHCVFAVPGVKKLLIRVGDCSSLITEKDQLNPYNYKSW